MSHYGLPGTEKVWQKPTLRDDEPGTQHTVGWSELFFDLIFVVVIAVLADNLSEREGLLPFAIQFIAIFWVLRLIDKKKNCVIVRTYQVRT